MNNEELRNTLDQIDKRFTTVLSTLGVITWAVNAQFESCENDFEACLGAALDGVYEALNTLQGDYQTMTYKIRDALKEGATNGKE